MRNNNHIDACEECGDTREVEVKVNGRYVVVDCDCCSQPQILTAKVRHHRDADAAGVRMYGEI